MPAYNEEAGIEDAVKEVQDEILKLVPDGELIVVNDGSRDRTSEILHRLSASDPRVKVIDKPNSGHGPSVVVGLEQARGEYVFLLDSDRQIPLDCFARLWEAARQCDGAFGMRSNRQDPRFRLFLSTVIRLSVRVLFGVDTVDTNIPCKLFRRSIWTELSKILGSE